MDNIVNLRKDLLERATHDPFLSLICLDSVGHYVNNTTTYFHNWRILPEETVVIYCEDGLGYIEDDKGFKEIKPKDLLIIAPGVPHRYGNKDGSFWTIGWAHIRGSEHAKMIQCHAETQPKIVTGSLNLRDALRRLPRILSEENLDSLKLATIDFMHAMQDLNNAKKESAKRDDKILELKNYIEKNYKKNLSLNDLARRIDMSKYQLIKRFKSSMDVSPIEYLNQRRVYHATRMLSFTNEPIGLIAEKVGVLDPYYFSRLFKKIVGVSPRQYRKRGH
jgi:AraC-like DNA-binding protein